MDAFGYHRVGATADARHIRPHKQAVQKELRQIDPELEVAKG